MKIKTQELTGSALDWAVAKCQGWLTTDPFRLVCGDGVRLVGGIVVCLDHDGENELYSPSEDWAQGGPIIERQKIALTPSLSPSPWAAHRPTHPAIEQVFSIGTTPLVAAMRCYVASKLGDEVEIPEELL